jgi:hypothetical protein
MSADIVEEVPDALHRWRNGAEAPISPLLWFPFHLEVYEAILTNLVADDFGNFAEEFLAEGVTFPHYTGGSAIRLKERENPMLASRRDGGAAPRGASPCIAYSRKYVRCGLVPQVDGVTPGRGSNRLIEELPHLLKTLSCTGCDLMDHRDLDIGRDSKEVLAHMGDEFPNPLHPILGGGIGPVTVVVREGGQMETGHDLRPNAGDCRVNFRPYSTCRGASVDDMPDIEGSTAGRARSVPRIVGGVPPDIPLGPLVKHRNIRRTRAPP